MENEIRSLTALKAKSEELQIPYANLLPAFVLEEAMLSIHKSEEAENFWLKNDTLLSAESYRRKVPLRLEYVFDSEEELNAQEMVLRMRKIFRNEKNAELMWKYQVEKIKDKIRVHLTGKIEGLQIPAQLLISQKTDPTLNPVREEIHLLLQNDQAVEYLHYPVEGILAEHFIKVIKNLELLSDLSSYYILYDLLRKEMSSTRKVTEQIEELAERQHVPVDKERFDMVLGYRESSYMKKKWKAFLRKEKRQTPSFEEVLDVMAAYFEPIWEALTEGSYYLGDWMPELMRYLD